MFRFEDGTLVKNAYVEIDGKKYNVNMPEYSGKTPMSAENLNRAQRELRQEIEEDLENDVENKIGNLVSGSPLVANSIEEMTDTSRVYVNTTDGNWYYYNGTSWVSGGIYQSTGFSTDKTLSINSGIADAKVVGDRLDYLEQTEILSESNYEEGKSFQPQGSTNRRYFLKIKNKFINTLFLYVGHNINQLDSVKGNFIVEGWKKENSTYQKITDLDYNYELIDSTTGLIKLKIDIYSSKYDYVSIYKVTDIGYIYEYADEGKETYYINDSTNESFESLNIQPNSILVYEYYYKIKKSNIIIVNKKGKGDYLTIQDAIENCNDSKNNPVTILIMPGDYEKFSMVQTGSDVTDITKRLNGQEWHKMRYINLIGFDRENTRIISDNGEYATPPAEILNCGTIANLSFIATHDNPPETSYMKGSYAVHIDFASEGHRQQDSDILGMDYTGQKLLFDNCYFYSGQSASVGIGTHQDDKITFNNCIFESETPASGDYAEWLHFGCLLVHNFIYAKDVTNQNIELVNCKLKSSNSPHAIVFNYNDNRTDKTNLLNPQVSLDARFNVAISENGSPISIDSNLGNIYTDTTFGNNFNN